ncbi:hypothetical protein NHX12_026190 [Muraenolepis orangiensis]|uniref:Uncharacterized protein n=1 Tax=Muraenolepis orangiensis TaxID=630683 RepID=A0A9Q0IRN3_9TELE|nr:hypothetical protein NHX12_026190 [Muraenolepis orangiensis]
MSVSYRTGQRISCGFPCFEAPSGVLLFRRPPASLSLEERRRLLPNIKHDRGVRLLWGPEASLQEAGGQHLPGGPGGKDGEAAATALWPRFNG